MVLLTLPVELLRTSLHLTSSRCGSHLDCSGRRRRSWRMRVPPLSAGDVHGAAVMIALPAGAINAGANWIFVYGHSCCRRSRSPGRRMRPWSRACSGVVSADRRLVNERARPSGLHDVPFTSKVPGSGGSSAGPAAMQVTLGVGVFARRPAAARITPLALASTSCAERGERMCVGLSSSAPSASARRWDGRPAASGWRAGGARCHRHALIMSALFVVEPRMFLRMFTSDATLLRVGGSLIHLRRASAL